MKMQINKVNKNKIINSYYFKVMVIFDLLNKIQKHNPRFCMTFNLKYELLAKKLLNVIGYGFKTYKPKNKACVFTCKRFEKSNWVDKWWVNNT